MKPSQNNKKDSKQTNKSINSQISKTDTRIKNNIIQPQQKGFPKTNSIDLKKVNLTKNPNQSNSSLQLLILLLNRTLKLSLQEILGLFTNQNKYLAHIIVKGVNDDFQGIKQFYSLMNQNIDTLLKLYEQDHQDTFACLYAIKPGFISKDQHVSELTLKLFNNFSGIYEWLISKQSKCSTTLLLGFKRHQKLIEQYSDTLFSLIKGHQVEFFGNHYVSNILTSHQLISITSKLLKYLPKFFVSNNQQKQQSLINILQKNGIFQKWFDIAKQFYDGSLDDKLFFLQFIGQFMLYLPQIMEKNLSTFNLLKQNWVNFNMITFVPLFNQILIILQKLANSKNTMSKRLYNIIVDIFNDTYAIEDKRQFIVNGFFSIISQFPNIPSDLFIKNYHLGILTPSDFLLICEAIDISQDQINLIRIGQIIRDIFFFDATANYYLGNLIVQIVKKIGKFQTKQTIDFITQLFKSILSNYVAFASKIKNQSKNNTDDTYFGKKKTPQKNILIKKNQSALYTKRAQLTLDLCEKIIDIIFILQVQDLYLNTLKNYIMITNAQIKKSNYGTGPKRLSSILQKKLKISKQDEIQFQDQNKQNHNKSNFRISQSQINKKARQSYGAISALSRVQVPQKITKQFDQIIAKRKRQEELKVEQQLKKKKEDQLKKILYKKQLQKMNLIKGGFGQGQAQLKEQGFWNKFIKENQQIKVFTHQQVEDTYLQAADLIIKKYNRLFKYFFFNYSNTMYSVKASNFDENLLKKQTLSAVQIIKFLKDYNLIFPTNLQQIQHLVKQINIKILHRKQVVNELDFQGFQEFLKQFCLCIWNRDQRIVEPQQKSIKLQHLSLPELLENLIDHLKKLFKAKGQNMSFFDVFELQTETSSADIRQINEKLKQNPNFILPQGFRKITDKKMEFRPVIRDMFKINGSFKTCYQVLDQIIFQCFFFHIIQPQSQKVVKVTAKPFHQISVRDRDPTKIKARALSTIIDRKTAHSSLGIIINKNDLSKGMKRAMLQLKTQDKIVGQQVAFVLEQILLKIAAPQTQKQEFGLKKLNPLQKSGDLSRKKGLSRRKAESVQKMPDENIQKIQKVLNQGKDLLKIKTEIFQRRQQKMDQEKKREEQIQQKLKRKKQQQQKYYQELKLKVQERKTLSQVDEIKKKQILQVKEKRKQAKQKFEDFNAKQVDKLKKQFQQTIGRKRKQQEDKQTKNQQDQDKKRKIRNKIQNQDKMITKIRKQTLQGIIEISYSDGFKNLIKQYQQPLKHVFDYMQKHSLNPLAQKKCQPGQIDFDTWLKFNKTFEISPLIVNSKDAISIFKAVTKDKRVPKQYLIGLTYTEFLQCILRQCIKQKTIFKKITERIKDQPSALQIDIKNKKQKSVPVKVQIKNQFQEDEQLDIKKLLKQPDVRDDIIDHYGDLSNFNVEYFKGLIYYLKMPFTKKGQQKRVKELIENEKKTEAYVSNLEKLKEKLKAQYTLQRTQKDKKQTKPELKQLKQLKGVSKNPKVETKQKNQKEEVKSKKSQKK